jgi:O-antigen/teichoic acid export membrane protein
MSTAQQAELSTPEAPAATAAVLSQLPAPDRDTRVEPDVALYATPASTSGDDWTQPVHKKSVIGRNIAALLGSQMVTWAIALVVAVIVPRYIGPDGVGQLRLGEAIWAVAIVLAELGTSMLLTIEFAQSPPRGFAMLRPVIGLRLFGATLATLGVFVFAVIAGYTADTILIIGLVGVGCLALMLGEAARVSLYGLQWMTATARIDVIGKALIAVLSIVVLVLGGRTAALAVAGVVASVVITTLFFRTLLSRRADTAPAELPSRTGVLRRSSPFFFGSVVLAAYTSLDVVVLSLIATQEEIGWYALAATLMGTLLFLPSTVMTSVFPAVAQTKGEDAAALPGLVARAFRSNLLVAVPVGIGTVVIAESLVTMLFGSEFAGSGPVLAVGGIVVMLMFETMLIGGVARAIGRVRIFNVAITLALFLTIPLDLVFVSWTREAFDNGAIGGAISYVCTEFMILVVLIWKVCPTLLSRATLVRVLKCAAAGAALFVVAWPLREAFIAVPVLAGALAYVVAVIVLRIPDDSEREYIHKAWTRVRKGATLRRRGPLANEAPR